MDLGACSHHVHFQVEEKETFFLVLKKTLCQGPGHPIFVFACVYGRAFGFFQRPRSSRWSFHPGLSLCSSWSPQIACTVQSSFSKVFLQAYFSSPDFSIRLTRQCSGTSYPESGLTLSGLLAIRVPVSLFLVSIWYSKCGLCGWGWPYLFLDFLDGVLDQSSWSHLICLYVYVICLSGTWWVLALELHQLSYSL